MLGVFLDIETNGLDPYVHISLEIAFKIVDLKNGKLLEEYSSIIFSQEADWRGFDANSLLINGFQKEELNQGKTRTEIQKEIKEIFAIHDIRRGRSFFICQNPSFDRPFFGKIIPPYEQENLFWPYHWLDLASMYWVLKLVKEQKTREFDLNVSKDSIALSLGLEKEAKPHRAMNGVNHLLACYTHLVGFPEKK
jgi:DNA polymerase-3 subunit epsilon/oligoribonuclease